MTNSSKDKGDAAEREAARVIRDHLGYPAERMLGAGRRADIGDIAGVPNTTIQVAAWNDVSAAAIAKPREAERQRVNAGTPYAATFVRFRGGTWRVVLTVEQWAALVREVNA